HEADEEQLPPGQIAARPAGEGRRIGGPGVLSQQLAACAKHKQQCGQQRYMAEHPAMQTKHQSIPGCDTLIPLSAILSASGLGATSKAVGRSINSSSM